MFLAMSVDVPASAQSRSGSARVAVFINGGTMSVGCMRSTSGVCHVLIKSSKGLERLDVNGGTVGRVQHALGAISMAVGSEPLEPKHCVFHEIVQDNQMISGPEV